MSYLAIALNQKEMKYTQLCKMAFIAYQSLLRIFI